MSPAQINFELTELQLARFAASGGDRAPLMWTRFEAADDSGRAFVCHVRFDDHGPDARVAFELDAAVHLHDDEWWQRLDAAIFFDEAQRWRH